MEYTPFLGLRDRATVVFPSCPPAGSRSLDGVAWIRGPSMHSSHYLSFPRSLASYRISDDFSTSDTRAFALIRAHTAIQEHCPQVAHPPPGSDRVPFWKRSYCKLSSRFELCRWAGHNLGQTFIVSKAPSSIALRSVVVGIYSSLAEPEANLIDGAQHSILQAIRRAAG